MHSRYINIYIYPHAKTIMPKESEGIVDFVLRAAIETQAIIPPKSRISVCTGVALNLGKGQVAQVCNPSDQDKNNYTCIFGAHHMITHKNKEEIVLPIFNHGKSEHVVKRGDPIGEILFINALSPIALFGYFTPLDQ